MRVGVRAKLFLVLVGLIAVSVTLADVYLGSVLEGRMARLRRDDLGVRLELVAHRGSSDPAPTTDLSAWDRLADELGKAAQARVTFVRRDGVVIGDSDVAMAELARLENHAHRPEVEQAFAAGQGASTRYSMTLHDKLAYAALAFDRAGEPVVARLSEPISRIGSSVDAIRRLLLIGTLIALGITVLGSTATAARVSRVI